MRLRIAECDKRNSPSLGSTLVAEVVVAVTVAVVVVAVTGGVMLAGRQMRRCGGSSKRLV
jgi:hypothetical protein